MRKLTHTRGFTIVETLVAIVIVVTVVIGTTSAIQSAISSYVFSKDQITAFFLAQEAFEQLRNMRDENHLKSRGWLSGLSEASSDPCYFGSACMVSPIETSVATRCDAPGACKKLRQDATTGFFGYDNSAWPETIYRREIVLEPVNANEIAATVTVSWSKGLVNRQFKARENILNWQ